MHMAMSAIKLGDIDQALIIGEVQLNYRTDNRMLTLVVNFNFHRRECNSSTST